MVTAWTGASAVVGSRKSPQTKASSTALTSAKTSAGPTADVGDGPAGDVTGCTDARRTPRVDDASNDDDPPVDEARASGNNRDVLRPPVAWVGAPTAMSLARCWLPRGELPRNVTFNVANICTLALTPGTG